VFGGACGSENLGAAIENADALEIQRRAGAEFLLFDLK
jgi:hypothetical protein